MLKVLDIRLGMCLSKCSFLVKDFPQYAQKTIVTVFLMVFRRIATKRLVGQVAYSDAIIKLQEGDGVSCWAM